MATKTATKKKTTTKKAATTTRKAPVKKTTAPAKRDGGYGVLYERCPEDHVATGKYKFFFVFFAFTTVVFAAVSIWMIIFSAKILDKWEMLDTCARTGQTCEVTIRDNNETEDEDVEDEVVDEDTEDTEEDEVEAE